MAEDTKLKEALRAPFPKEELKMKAGIINSKDLDTSCWSIQFWGKEYCQTCEYNGTKDCGANSGNAKEIKKRREGLSKQKSWNSRGGKMIKGDIRVETIRVLHHHCGYSLGDIARVFGLSRVRIYQIMSTNGISRRAQKGSAFTIVEWKEFAIKLMAELRRNRYTGDKIGKLMGISDKYVLKILKNYGFEKPLELRGSSGRKLFKPEDIFSGKLPCYDFRRRWVLSVLPHVCSECGKDEKATKKLYVVKEEKYPKSFLDFRVLCHNCYFKRHTKLMRGRKILKEKAEN